MRGARRSPRRLIEASEVDILMLTSEFSSASGEIGTYARTIAVVVTRLGASATMVAPDISRREAHSRSVP